MGFFWVYAFVNMSANIDEQLRSFGYTKQVVTVPPERQNQPDSLSNDIVIDSSSYNSGMQTSEAPSFPLDTLFYK